MEEISNGTAVESVLTWLQTTLVLAWLLALAEICQTFG
jgi:hypothetical protein